MDHFRQDVRQSLRFLLKNRGFTTVAVATLALGIGATTAVFSVVDAVLLRPLPYPDAGRLVRVSEQLPAMGPAGGPAAFKAIVTSDTFDAWRESARTLDGIAAYSRRAYTLTGMGEPVRLRGTAVSAAMFPLLRVAPERGRTFNPGEDRAGADQVAVLSDALWTRRFSRDPGIVGRALTLDGKPVTVVGVMPAAFSFPDPDSEIWTPMTIDIAPAQPGQRFVLAFSALARLRDGVSLAQAQAEGTSMARAARPAPPARLRSASPSPAAVRLIPLRDEMVAGVRPALFVLLGAVVFVLLIAAANIANLLLARGAARRRELAVRSALGAGGGRLVRQLLTESVLLGLVGGAAGILLASVLDRVLPAITPGNIPRIDEVGLDGRVLAFGCLISVAAGFFFGLAPALQARRIDVLGALNEAGIQQMGGFRLLKGNRLRSALVVAEVALSIVLLAGAGLLVRSFLRLVEIDPGYDPANVITAQISPPSVQYGTPERQRGFFDQLLARVAATPGVTAAGTTNLLPLLSGNMVITFGIEGQPEPASRDQMPRASVRIVSTGYAEAMGLKLRAGRFLTASDRAGAPPVAVASETLVRQYLSGRGVGSRIRLFGPGPVEIVGVVGDVRSNGLDADPQPELYIPFPQVPDRMRMATPSTALVVRSAGNPLALVPFVRRAVLDVDSDIPLDNVMTMAARVSASVAEPRFYALLVGAFALAALALAAVGIYGVLSYNVSQRHREIGVRMALGANRGDIVGLVVGQGLWLTAAGVAIGLAGALGLTRFLKALLFGIATTDPITYVAVTALLVAVALAACWVPARRATRVDPMAALRYE